MPYNMIPFMVQHFLGLKFVRTLYVLGWILILISYDYLAIIHGTILFQMKLYIYMFRKYEFRSQLSPLESGRATFAVLCSAAPELTK